MRLQKKKRSITALTLIMILLLQLFYQPLTAKAEENSQEEIDFTQSNGCLLPDQSMFQTAKLWSDESHLVDGNKIPINITLALDTSDQSMMQEICSELLEEAFANKELYEEGNEDNQPASTIDEIEQYINNLDDDKLAPIIFTCTFAGAGLLEDTVFEHEGNITDQNSDILGAYQMTENSEEKSVTLTVTFEKVVYARSDISYEFSGWLKLSNSESDRIQPLFFYDGASQKVMIDLTSEPVSLKDSETTFSIMKSATVSGNGIDYTITAKAKQTSNNKPVPVAQKIIYDMIPQGLEIISVEDNQGVIETNTYLINNQAFSYQIPEYEPESEDLAYTMIIHTTMTDECFIGLMKQNDNGTDTFTSIVQLLAAEDNALLAESDPVTSKLEIKNLEKNGSIGNNGRFMNWTLNGSLYFTDAANVYIIDSIDNISVHDYTGNTISITYTKMDLTQEQMTYVMEEIPEQLDKKQFDDITVEDAAAYTSSGSSVICYRIDTNEDGIEDQAVLIIPMASAKGITDEFNHLHGAFEIHYATEVMGAHAEDTGTTRELSNQARLVWEWANLNGTGPAIERFASADINKTVKTNYSLVEKTAGTYDETTQILSWNFAINHYGTEITTIEIADCLDLSKMKLKNSYGTGSILELSSSKSGQRRVPYSDGVTIPSGDYFMLETENQKLTITLHLEEIDQEEKISFRLDTIITDLSILTSQGVKDKKVVNTATASAIVDGSLIVKKMTASLFVSNTLLKKKAIDYSFGTYDYENHAVKWQVIVNPDFLTIDQAVLTESLPEGVLFGHITSIMRVDASGNTIALVADPQEDETIAISDDQTLTITDVSDEEQTAFTVTFSNQVMDKYIIEYTSEFSQEYRNQYFTVNQEVSVDSNSSLAGTISTVELDNVEASAQHIIEIPFLVKSGMYSTDLSALGVDHIPHVTWTIDVNPMEANINGASIRDNVQNCFELLNDDIDAATVSVVIKNPDGSDKLVTDITKATASQGALIVDNSHVAFTVPETVSASCIRIIVITTFTEDTDKDNMKNQVSIGGGILEHTSTSSAKAENASSVSMEDYAASNRPKYLKIIKTSINSQMLNDLPLYHIPDTTFTLTSMIYQNGCWTADPSAAVRVRTTKDDGSLSFMFLRKDTLYRIEEIAASTGYQKSADYVYVYYNDTADSETYAKIIAANFKNLHTVIGTEKSGTVVIMKNNPGTSYDQGGVISFYKITDDDSDTPIPQVTFTLIDVKGKLVTRQAVSDEQGLVTFTGLDPGVYRITEETSEYCEPVSGYLTATVTVSGRYQTVVESGPVSGSNPLAIESKNGIYYVKNTLAQPLPTATPTPAPTPTPVPGTIWIHQSIQIPTTVPSPTPVVTTGASITPAVTTCAGITPAVSTGSVIEPVVSSTLSSTMASQDSTPVNKSESSEIPETGDHSVMPVLWLTAGGVAMECWTRKKKQKIKKET